MEIVNIRIDDRLIHGQVAAVWSLVTRATRIMVVDDEVVHDAVNKRALKMACPTRCKLSILTAERASENMLAGKYEEDEKIFIVVKNPKTLCAMYDHGFRFTAVNVGNMGGKQDTVMLKKAVSVSKADIERFQYLADKGITITAQMVPNDPAEDFIELIQKAEK